MNINDLREKRAKLLTEARAMTELENYGEVEKTKTDNLIKEIDKLEARIKLIEVEEAAEMRELGAGNNIATTETNFRGEQPTTVFQFPHFHVKKQFPSLGKILRAMATGEKDLRTLGASSDATGGVLTGESVSTEVIQALMDESVLTRAGAKIVDLRAESTTLPKIITPATVSWRPENELITNNNPGFGKTQFTPKTVASIVKTPNELLEDAIGLEQAIVSMFVRTLAQEMDRVSLMGDPVNDEPNGLVNWENISMSYDLADGPLTNQFAYTIIAAAISRIMSAKSPAPNALVMSPEILCGLEVMQSTTYDSLKKPGLIADMKWLSTSALSGGSSSNVFIGHFPNLAIGIRSQLKIKLLDQRYADYYQTAWLASMRMDVAGLWEQSFALLQNCGHPLNAYS